MEEKELGPRHWRDDSNATVINDELDDYEEEREDAVDNDSPPKPSSFQLERTGSQPSGLSRTVSARTDTSSGKIIIGFMPGDPENPYNWSRSRKLAIVVFGIMSVLNSTLSSALPSSDEPKISARFNVHQQQEVVLPISMYLLGYVLGPLLFAPLSESFGRRIITSGTFLGFFIFSIVLPVSPNWPAFVIFRLLQGVFAASPISVTGAIYADMYANPVYRGRAMASFMGSTMFGPICAPIASGYLQVYSWRWPFWFGLIFAGVSLPFVLWIPETYGPVILQKRARKMRKEDPDGSWNVYAPLDLEKESFQDLVTKFLGRPFRMLFTEPLVGFSSLFMSFVYGVFYILLVAYPQIYPPIYGFTLGEQGLAFLGLAVGVISAVLVYLWWDNYLSRAKKNGKAWADKEEYRRLPLAAIGGPFFAVSLFWVGWSARQSVHWIVPIIGGVPLGFGYVILFMGFINYIVDAYARFAASGLAASAASRSFFGAVLPYAATPLYQNLGIAWACSLLGFISIGFCFVPFIFIRYGDSIRSRSKLCQELAEMKRTEGVKEAKRLRRMQLMQQNKMGHDDPEKMV